ncbi:TIGR04283 family arsenosugar biosynthesis glycosyltransferase [Solemya velum gill symbiont]|nr:TIGR04283 family arsenosugar biosynthesis glycosyltransferase [Solemya velum gill symbiont]KHF24760.1 glycosyltransferase [Solemya velum gill symbiont]
MPAISIIIPALNEAETIEQTLSCLQMMRGRNCEVILVDGGSNDATMDLAGPLADRILTCEKGRANQLEHGVKHSTAPLIWFLHADTRVPENTDEVIEIALEKQDATWGRFNVRLDGRHPLFRIIEKMMNYRSCITGICTGDQGIFVRRDTLEAIGGVPRQALMEDIELSKRLKTTASPLCMKQVLVTSSRRWQEKGVIRTVLLMWYLRAAYAFGVPAGKLARLYR